MDSVAQILARLRLRQQITPIDSSARRFGAIMQFKTLLCVPSAAVRGCFWRACACVPSRGKFSRASSAGGRRHLRKKIANRIVSVAEDCLSPERTFHGGLLMHFRGSIPWLKWV